MSLLPPKTVEKLQRTLHAKAKESHHCQRSWGEQANAHQRLRRWSCRKHKQGQRDARSPDEYLRNELGFAPLRLRTRHFRVRTHESLSESRMRENRTSGLMRGRRGNGARSRY